MFFFIALRVNEKYKGSSAQSAALLHATVGGRTRRPRQSEGETPRCQTNAVLYSSTRTKASFALASEEKWWVFEAELANQTYCEAFVFSQSDAVK